MVQIVGLSCNALVVSIVSADLRLSKQSPFEHNDADVPVMVLMVGTDAVFH